MSRSFARRQFLCTVQFPDGNLHRFGRAVAQDLHRNRSARVRARDLKSQPPAVGDLLAVELGDYITGFEPSLGGGTVRRDVGNDRAVRLLEIEFFSKGRGDILDGNSEISAG